MPVQFYLFTRPDKQGDHPINVSISLFGERLCTSVGYAIAPDKWDDKTQHVKKNAYNSKKVAYNLINSRLNLIHGHFERLEAIEKKLTKDEIRSELATLIKRKEKVSKTGNIDPDTIHRHANRIRLIIVELVGKMDYLRHLLGESHEKK